MEIKAIDPEKCEGVKIYKDERTFFVDEMYPLILRYMGNEEYMMLFMGKGDISTKKVFFNVTIKEHTAQDHDFIVNYPLNSSNIIKNPDMIEFYNDAVKDIGPADLFLTDFNFNEVMGKPIYTFNASRKTPDNSICETNVIITREVFIKLNLFFVRFQNHITTAAGVFADIKLKNIKYSKIDHVKLDGTGTDLASKVVCSHYTCGNGPEIYKFNFLSVKQPGKKLRCPMTSEVYERFYSNDFVVKDIFYYDKNNSFFVIYEVRSDITDKYKETKALIFTKEYYEKTNIANPNRIYEKEN